MAKYGLEFKGRYKTNGDISMSLSNNNLYNGIQVNTALVRYLKYDQSSKKEKSIGQLEVGADYKQKYRTLSIQITVPNEEGTTVDLKSSLSFLIRKSWSAGLAFDCGYQPECGSLNRDKTVLSWALEYYCTNYITTTMLTKTNRNFMGTVRYFYCPAGKNYKAATEFLVNCKTGQADAALALAKEIDFGTAKITLHTDGNVNLSLRRKLPYSDITVGCKLNTTTGQFTPGLHVAVVM